MKTIQNKSRRRFLKRSLALSIALTSLESQIFASEAEDDDLLRSRISGLLYGCLIGDAAGGPVEFKPVTETKDFLADVRNWDEDRTVDAAEIEKLAQTFPLLDYQTLRPGAEPYGQWTKKAPAGTVTDDTRHKIVLLRKLRELDGKRPLNRNDLAAAYVAFGKSKTVTSRPHYQPLCEEGMIEHVKAAKWILGERDADQAAPPSRIWGGLSTCCGQMTLPPVACIFVGQPKLAYQASYHLAFFDNGPGLDINSAIVAGLATALATDAKQARSQRWKQVTDTMRSVDPYHYHDIPYVDRRVNQWLDIASKIAAEAKGSPKKLFKLLEKDGKPKYFWEAHFILVCVFSMVEFCDGDGMAAMHLALDFGHDTDSVAQLIGAFTGATEGADVFPNEMRRAVQERVAADYDESVEAWTELLTRLSQSESPVFRVD